MNAPLATVVIPTYNAAAFFGRQLEALTDQDTDASWELVISDNGSEDSTLDILRSFRSRLPLTRVVHAGERRGPSFARNRGAQNAQGQYLLFCDADDVADSLWIHEMLRVLRGAPLVAGALHASPLNPAHISQWRGEIQRGGVPVYAGRPYVVSANMGCSATLFRDLGGFDVDFPAAAFEDVDFAIRAADIGVTPVFAERAVINYRHRSDLSAALQQASLYGRATGTFFRKHPEAARDAQSLRDDFRLYGSYSRRAARELVQRRTISGGLRWYTRFHTCQTFELAQRREYWSLQPRVSQKASISRDNRNRLRRLLARVATPSVDNDQPLASDPWAVASSLTDLMSLEDRHRLGAGLLADADVTINCQRADVEYFLNPSLDSIVVEVIEQGSYSDADIARMVTYLAHDGSAPSACIINLGANVGTTAIPFAKAGFKVLAVEPATKAYELLKRNVQANALDHSITVLRAAISVESTVTLVVGDNLSTSEVLSSGGIAATATPGDDNVHLETVRGAALDHLVAETLGEITAVGLVWSDTEGCETEVIATGKRLWSSGVPLWVEVRPAALRRHGGIAAFVSQAHAFFAGFFTASDLDSRASERPITELREFIDRLSVEQWAFTNILLVNGRVWCRNETDGSLASDDVPA